MRYEGEGEKEKKNPVDSAVRSVTDCTYHL